ncbi:MAG: autotransporter-associated beta strand repeat-containing protein, partial [Thermoguttaceae bacterium]
NVYLPASSTLNLNSTSALGPAAGATLTITGGTLDNTSSAAVTLTDITQQKWNGDFTYGGTQNLTIGTGPTGGSVALNGNRTITVNGTPPTAPTGANDNFNINCPISGTGFSLTKQGPGALAIRTAVSYTGDTYILGGLLDISDGTNGNLALATSPIIHIENGAELVLRGHSNALALGTTNTIDIPTGTSGLIYGRDSPSVDPLGFTSGTGTLTLTEASGATFTLGNGTSGSTGAGWNQFTGTLQLRNTTLTAGATFRTLYNSSTVPTMNTSVALDIGPWCTFTNRNADPVTNLGSLSGGDSTSYLQSAGATNYHIGFLGTNTVYAGNINTGLSITKEGAGNLTLTGSCTYTGTTTITNGTLQIGNGGTTGTLAGGALTNNGALWFNRTDASGATGLIVNNAITGSGSIKINSGAVYFNSTTNTVANPVEVKGGATLGGQATITSPVTVDASGNIESGQASVPTTSLTLNSLTYSGAGSFGFTLPTSPSATPLLNVSNGVVTNGSHTIALNILGSTIPANGTYDLIRYGTSITNFGDFYLGPLPGSGSRPKTYNLVNNSGSHEIDLSIGGSDNAITWTGSAGGSWDTTVRLPSTTNWKYTNPASGTNTDFYQGDNVTFDDSAATKTVTISSVNVNPSSLTFNNSAGNDYTITGTNGIGNGATVHKASGAGRVTISTNNTYTGATTINAGTISIASDGTNPGDASPLGAVPLNIASGLGNVVLSGGALNASASFTLHANRGVNVGPTSGTGNGTIDVDGGYEFIVAGVIANNGAGTGNLVKTGDGALTLNAANTFSGTTTISGGILRLGNASALQNSTLNYNYPGGTGGTLSFGSLTIGTITDGHAGTCNESGWNAVNIQGLNGSQDLSLTTDASGAALLQVGNGNVDCTYSGALTGSGTFMKTGTGTMTLTGNSSYNGATYVNRGNVIVSAGGLATGAAIHIANDVPGYGSGSSIANVTFSGTSTSNFSALDIGTNSRAGGNFTIQDSATVTVAGNFDINNEEMSGGDSTVTTNNQINLNGGTLTVVAFVKTNTQTGNAHLATINFNGGTLAGYGTILPADSATFQGVTCNVQAGGAKFDVVGSTMQINHALVHDTTSGAPATDGGLHLLNSSLTPGTLILTGNNTYTGTTAIDANATLQVGDYGLTVGGTGTLGTGPVNNNGAIVLNRTGTFTLPNAIGGTGSLTQQGFGSTAILTSPNTYSGPTTITAGTLILTGTQLTSGVTVNGFGASFGAGTGGTTIPSLTLADASTLIPSDGTSLTSITVSTSGGLTNSGNTTIAPGNLGATVYTTGLHPIVNYSGAIGGGGSFSLTLPSRVSGVLVYNPGVIDLNITSVNYPRWNGTVNNGSGGRDWDFTTQNWTEYSNGAIGTTYQESPQPDFVYFDDTATGLTTVNLPTSTTVSPGQVYVNNNTKNYTIQGGGLISGTGALIKTGTGMLTIVNTGGNNYTGGTIISAGTLSFATGVLPAAPNSIIMDGGTLQWNGVNSDDVSDRLSFNSGKTAILDTNNNAVTFANPFSFDSTVALTKTGSGTLTITASTSTFTGNVNVNGGVLAVNASRNSVNPTAGALGNSQVAHNITVNNGGTLQFMVGDTFGGSSSGIRTTLTINSGGIVTNNGTNFTTLGPLFLNGGSLVANGGATALYQSFFLRGLVTVAGSSPSTISASGTYSGIHLYQTGAGTTFNVADVTGNANADLTVSAVLINGTDPSAGNAPGDLSNYPGILTKTGAGTMTVTQNATYTGNTTVNAGVLNMLNLNTPAATVAVTGTGSALNVSSITANTLTIGAGATVTIAAIPGGPLAGGLGSISPVPEPATWAMLMLAAMGLGIYRRRSR